MPNEEKLLFARAQAVKSASGTKDNPKGDPVAWALIYLADCVRAHAEWMAGAMNMPRRWES